MPHRYGPKGRLSPTLGTPCSLCGEPLQVGDYTTLVRMSVQSRYANDAEEAHWACAMSREQERTTAAG
jgi:hypothetical protein